MSNWPEGTSKRVLLVMGMVVLFILGAWFGVISPLQATLRDRANKAEQAQRQVDLARTSMDKGPQYRSLAEEKYAEIADLESKMAEKALLDWEWGTLWPYQKVYGIAIRGWESPSFGPVDVPPELPYAMATFGLTGQGHFHSFGAFLAAFENSSPFIKLKSLSLQAATPGLGTTDDPEELSFRIEYHILAPTNAVVAGR